MGIDIVARNFNALQELKSKGYLLKSGNNTPQKGFSREAGVKRFIRNPIREAQVAQQKTAKENVVLRKDLGKMQNEISSIKDMLGTLIKQTANNQQVAPIEQVKNVSSRIEEVTDRFIKLDDTKTLKTHTAAPDSVTHTKSTKAKDTISRLKKMRGR